MPTFPDTRAPVIVSPPTTFPLAHYLRHTLLSVLAPSQVQELGWLPAELTTMMEHAVLINPQAAEPLEELHAVLRDLEHIERHLLSLTAFPFGRSVAVAEDSARWADETAFMLREVNSWLHRRLYQAPPQSSKGKSP